MLILLLSGALAANLIIILNLIRLWSQRQTTMASREPTAAADNFLNSAL
jgi:hypothetical protein